MELSILDADYEDAKNLMHLLGHGADVNARDEYGNNALYLAIKQQSTGIMCYDSIDLLIHTGININCVNNGGVTALDLAVYSISVDIEIIETLLQNGAEVDREDSDLSLLTRAAVQEDEELFKLLLDHGANVDFLNSSGSSPMNDIGFLNDISTMSAVIERTRDINHRSESNSTPLCNAVVHGNVALVQMLLEAGADPMIAPVHIHPTLLHGALSKITEGTCDIVHLLLKSGLNVNDRSASDETPLLYAIDKCDIKIIKLLSDYGGDFTVKDDKGNSALHRAVQNSNKEVIKFVLNKGVDVNIKNHNGRTPLHITAGCGYRMEPDTCDILFDNGADIWCKDKYGDSPISVLLKARGYPTTWPRTDMIGMSFVAHVVQLEYRNFVIDQNDRELIKQLLEPFLKLFYEHCRDEVENIKSIMVYNHFSALDILFSNKKQMSTFAANEDIVAAINKLTPILCEDLVVYSPMLEKFQNEVLKQQQRKKVQKIINNIMGFNNPSHPICKSIASSLKVEDLEKDCLKDF